MGEARRSHGKAEMYESLQKCSEKSWTEVTTSEIQTKMEDNIETRLDTGREDAEWIPPAQGKAQCWVLVNAVTGIRAP